MKQRVEDLDWKNLGFVYRDLPYRYEAKYKDGQWQEGKLVEASTLTLSEGAEILHYGQEIFEGLKAYCRKDGKINLFRPEQNAHRFTLSAERLAMPPFPEDRFVAAVKQVVLANQEFVPPYDSGATLYLRPFMVGTSNVLGVQAANEYTFRIFAVPVGAYIKGLNPAAYIVSDYDRAAYAGTGQAKTAGNYASSLLPSVEAHQKGYADCLYLDPREHKYIDEFGGANFFGITPEGQFVTPKSPSILISITKKSLLELAKKQGLNPVERQITLAEAFELKEAGAMGTAAVISPVGSITYQGQKHVIYSEKEPGPITTKLYQELVDIQYGNEEGPEGWVQEISE
ncbi:branched-chain amino acid aminotransferase [Lactobacillus sp. ESL0236]|uniref:branched-chain amino acid aminotransferase n=1 Tax=unclassified Lactobacillus TaxID=2620435 RepID=UPI000EFD8FF2|nr:MULTISPECIES: branched-chain amino acid aminotransferase [unclassified Lactobacillus]RMC38725.1 branched-chain amino acid aminotransferase [Lactobacillus sp. ESL0237]RMC43070.1 branched-chain amino acid aminotransferase [Lactobacillus sp. ESL0234]RMC43924.1 branched-chain amino acid aminotransferase [Lactobacillus sp. ESL0236]